jgi:hypothetical protein
MENNVRIWKMYTAIVLKSMKKWIQNKLKL